MDSKDWGDCFGSNIELEDVFSEAIVAWDGVHSNDRVEKATGFFIRIYLQESGLAKVDRASMMNGLEVRSPFLDLDVVNFVRRIPSSWRLRRGKTKYLLKRAARGLVPQDIIDRKKKGFGIPVGSWFQSGGLQINPKEQPCPTLAARLEKEHISGRRNHRLFLWNAWVYGQWKKTLG